MGLLGKKQSKVTAPRDADDLPDTRISSDDVAAEFAALEELERAEKFCSIDEVEVLEG